MTPASLAGLITAPRTRIGLHPNEPVGSRRTRALPAAGPVSFRKGEHAFGAPVAAFGRRETTASVTPRRVFYERGATVLVIGARNAIGSALIEELLSGRESPRALVPLDEEHGAAFPDEVEV